MFRDQYFLQSHISRHANLYLGSGEDRLHILRHCHGNNSIRYSDQCQQPGLWPCHERYTDKQVTPTARHNSQGEVPYEKTKIVPNYPDKYEIIY